MLTFSYVGVTGSDNTIPEQLKYGTVVFDTVVF